MTLTTNKKALLLILIALIFSFAVRLIWVQQFSGYEQFKYNGEFMINTNDGYYWAEGARDILARITEKTNDFSPIDQTASVFTAFLAKVVPISFETLIFYMPAFFSSLIVIPIILIAKEFKKLEVGFIAALVGSIAWSYYNRTMVGYYDTDMLNIVFPTFLVWSLILALYTKEEKYLLFTGFEIVAYRLWYPQSYSLEFAFFGFVLLYTAYLAYKKRDFNYELKLLIMILFSMLNLPSIIRLIIVVAIYIFSKKEIYNKYIYYVLALAVLSFFVTGGFSPIWSQLKGYVFRDAISVVNDKGLGLHFFTVMQTVREAGQISFETFANRISGHTVTFVLSVIGYIWMSVRYPVMLLAIPMVGLGFLALNSGLRFTIYAVPIMALGLGYLIVEVSNYLSNKFINDKAALVLRYVFMSVLTLAALYPNIKHVQEYKVPTVFNKQEVEVLDKLRNIAGREDYVVSWWDYGYPIRYYSDVKTLVDGGKHGGQVNFPVSYILNSSQKEAANMARLDVEYTEKVFKIQKEDENLSKEEKRKIFSNIEQMTLDHSFKDTNDFLSVFEYDMELPNKTRDIYLYLPNRMLNIFPTVTLFSNIDLMNGKQKAKPFFFTSRNFKEDQEFIHLGQGIKILKRNAEIQIGNQTFKINNFVSTEYDANGILRKNIQSIDYNAPINVIFMKNYNQFLVLDNKMYNSTYIQLFALENYDKELFEPVILDPLAKVYKLKI